MRLCVLPSTRSSAVDSEEVGTEAGSSEADARDLDEELVGIALGAE
jgi:hypothetical protein